MEVINTAQFTTPVSEGCASSLVSDDAISGDNVERGVSNCLGVEVYTHRETLIGRKLSPSGPAVGLTCDRETCYVVDGDTEEAGLKKLTRELALCCSSDGVSPQPSFNRPSDRQTSQVTTTTISNQRNRSRRGMHGHHSQDYLHRQKELDSATAAPSLSCRTPPVIPRAVEVTLLHPSPSSELTIAHTHPPTTSTMDSDDNAANDNSNDDNPSHSCAVGDDDRVNNNVDELKKGSSVKSVTTTTTTGVTTADRLLNIPGTPVRSLRVRGQRKFLPEKTRQKRQTLQDMTRPLKQWLLRHKDNPYPSKAQKVDLVSQSQMTLTQVSNWFANARRRLKNTVNQPDLTWASRIKLYNSCVEGNAELFSLCSDDSCPESDDMMEHRQSDTFHDDVTDNVTSRTATPDVTAGRGEVFESFNHNSDGGKESRLHGNYSHQHHHNTVNKCHSDSSVSPTARRAHTGLDDACFTFPKYKHSILHRYLSDAHQQALFLDEDSVAKSRDRHHSSSTGSRDFEELSTSSVSSPAQDVGHQDHLDDFSEEFETMALRTRASDFSGTTGEEYMHWMEIDAALALTSMARGRVINT